MDVQTNTAGRKVFSSLFDYAGLFPPAGLPMAEAVENYAVSQNGPHREMLNTFVLPASRLEEFREAAAPFSETKWRLSLLSRDWSSDRSLVEQFRQSAFAAEVVSVETRAISDAASILESVANVYVELPPGPELALHIETLSELNRTRGPSATGAHAKIRTGGLTKDAFPSCNDVAHFLVVCVRNNVAFKATAGLHHPVRSRRATCNDADAPVVEMHGFVNVLVATAVAMKSPEVGPVVEVLAQTDSHALTDVADLAPGAREVFHSIGSCSFKEPVDDLKELSWL